MNHVYLYATFKKNNEKVSYYCLSCVKIDFYLTKHKLNKYLLRH